MKTTFRAAAVVVVILGIGMGIAFGAGTTYGRSTAPQSTATSGAGTTFTTLARANTGDQAAGAGGQNRMIIGGQGRSALTGTLESVGSDSLTVATGQGASSKVAVDAKTTVQRMATGTLSDLKVGDRLAVMGQPGPDGTVVAVTIQVVGAGQ